MQPEQTPPQVPAPRRDPMEHQGGFTRQEIQDAVTAARDATGPSDAPNLLPGLRGTGSYTLPNGKTVVAEVTLDGMKQTYTQGRAPAPVDPSSLDPSYRPYFEKRNITTPEAPKPRSLVRRGVRAILKNFGK